MKGKEQGDAVRALERNNVQRKGGSERQRRANRPSYAGCACEAGTVRSLILFCVFCAVFAFHAQKALLLAPSCGRKPALVRFLGSSLATQTLDFLPSFWGVNLDFLDKLDFCKKIP